MTAIEQKRKLNYIPSLDGIRGFFCILIIVNHWRLTLPIVPIGWEVLQIFFVMSGFLITRILINNKSKYSSFRAYLKSFYQMRSLRIFPLYFIFLLFWLLMRLLLQNSELIQKMTDDLAQNWGFYFTYTSNLKTLFNPTAAESPFFVHLWSLGLEEQFYLFMPFLIFFLRGKWLKVAIITFILIPFITRPLGDYLLTRYHDDSIWSILFIYRNLPFQCDAFALGAAVAVFDLKFIKHPKRIFYVLLTVLIGLTIWNYGIFPEFVESFTRHYVGLEASGTSPFWYINTLGHPELLSLRDQYNYLMPLVNFTCFFMLLTSVRGNTLWPMLFHNPILIRIGKVTYGMYVFHFCVIILFVKVAGKVIGNNEMYNNPIYGIPLFIVYIVILYFLSEFSFKYIEGPFLKLKNKLR
ncbi:MAG: acyltransferase [Bacteroidetes bacterium]|nr:acyltransferase [Bacteroidota bacterium]